MKFDSANESVLPYIMQIYYCTISRQGPPCGPTPEGRVRVDGAFGPVGCGRLSAAGCVEGGGKRVQRVQKVQRVQRVVDCPAGNAYKVSVTVFPSHSYVTLTWR